MALIQCSECKAEISDKAEVCPKCGLPLKKAEKKIAKKGFKSGLMYGVSLGFLFGLVCGCTGYSYYCELHGTLPGYYPHLPISAAGDSALLTFVVGVVASVFAFIWLKVKGGLGFLLGYIGALFVGYILCFIFLSIFWIKIAWYL